MCRIYIEPPPPKKKKKKKNKQQHEPLDILICW